MLALDELFIVVKRNYFKRSNFQSVRAWNKNNDRLFYILVEDCCKINSNHSKVNKYIPYFNSTTTLMLVSQSGCF